MILDTYTWNNRLVVLITDKDQTNLEKQVKEFFEQHECDINDRNLKLLHFFGWRPNHKRTSDKNALQNWYLACGL